uniref:Uncharacterized protein n=1 Tax=Strongyloides stercoralis TaxID=6248 RepID=A0AAF5DNG4_STRER
MIRVLMNQVIHLYQFENDYQSMDDKLLRTCVYGISDKRNYFKQDAIFLSFFGQFSSRQVPNYHFVFSNSKHLMEYQKILEKVVQGDILQHIYLKLMIKHCISPAQQVLFFYNFIDLSYKKSCSIKIILCLMNYLVYLQNISDFDNWLCAKKDKGYISRLIGKCLQHKACFKSHVSCEYFFKAFVSVIFFLPDLMLETCYEDEKSFIKLYNFIWNYQKNDSHLNVERGMRINLNGNKL